MKKVLFLDRDGTLVLEPEDEQVDSLEKLEFYPGVFRGLGKIVQELDYELVMITNQDGLGTDAFPEDTFWPTHNKIIKAFKNEGIEFVEVLIDKTFPHDNAPTRKPGTALLTHYIKGDYDLANSYVVGDRDSDVELAKNLNCKGILIGEGNEEAKLCTKSWEAIYNHLKGQPRKVKVQRQTKETDIEVEINLDGTGKGSFDTGIRFFDHMLEQIAKHGNLDLTVNCTGDLHVDEHHSIEDVGLTLGEAFLNALGSKKGIARYGFLLPMDDCLAQVADFNREKIGEMPTEMFSHFFKSFSDTAQCNLNIKAEGENEHHKIESIFKAFAKSIKMAVAKTGEFSIPSTKGSL